MESKPSRRGFGLGVGTAAAAAVTAALVRPAPAAAAATELPGVVLMSDYAGADDTEKMRNALTAVAATSQGRRPAIMVPPGTTWATGTSPFQLFDGCQIVGGLAPETEFSYGSRVTCSGSAVFRLKQGSNARTQGVVIRNLGFEGTASTDWFEQVADGGAGPILAYSILDGISVDGFRTAFVGRMLGVQWTGQFYCNNATTTPFRLWGSDNKLWTDGGYLDSPNLADTHYLLVAEHLSKTEIGPVFITGDGPTPFRMNNGHHVRLRNLEFEAQGVPRPTAGAGIWHAGGIAAYDNPWLYKLMNNPASPARGAVHVSGGVCLLNQPVFAEDGTAATYAHVYCSAGEVHLTDPISWNHTAGASGRPARTLKYVKEGTGRIFVNGTEIA